MTSGNININLTGLSVSYEIMLPSSCQYSYLSKEPYQLFFLLLPFKLIFMLPEVIIILINIDYIFNY